MTSIKQFPIGLLNRPKIALWHLGAGLVYLACYYFGFLIRYQFSFPGELVHSFGVTAPFVVSVKCLIMFLLDKWRPTAPSRLRDLDAYIVGVSASAALFLLVNQLVLPYLNITIPKSVLLIDWGLCLGLICVSRVIWVPKSDSSANPPTWRQVVSYSILLILLCIGLLYGSLGYQPRLNVDWFNGDALFPTHLVEDVIVGGNSASGWLFPPAPFVFPDIVFALVSRAVTSQPALEMFLTGALLFLLVWISTYYGVAITTQHRRTAFLLVSLGAAGVVLALALFTTRTHLKYLFFPAYHTGTYAFAILLSALGVQLATMDSKSWRLLAAFILLGFCSGFSDLLTIAYVSAPLTSALAIGWLLNLVSLHRAAFISSLIWLSPLWGVFCARMVLRLYDFSTFSDRSIASTARAAELILLGLLTELKQLRPLFLCASGWLLATSVWLGLCLYKISRNKWNSQTLPVSFKRRIILLLTFALSGFSTMAALVVGGNYTLLAGVFDDAVRYLHPLIFTPLFFWPLLLPECVFDRLGRSFPKPIFAQIAVVLLLIPLGAIVYVGKGPNRLHRYVPGYVAHLDQIARERGLSQGAAYYWTARDVNLYSQHGLRVFSVNPELGYFDWMNNLHWVSGPFDEDHVPPRPEFVILSPREVYSREMAVESLGEPAEEIPLKPFIDGYTVLIYNRQGDHKLTQRLLKPTLSWKEGFYDREASGDEEWRWCASRGALKIKNISGETRSVRVDFECAIASMPTGALTIESSFYKGQVQVQNHKARFSEVLQLPPGEHTVGFSSDAPPLRPPGEDRSLVFQIRNFKVMVLPETEI